MDTGGVVRDLFGVDRALIGVVHLEPLPGTPRSSLPVDAIVAKAVAEARLYADAGFHALIIENMGDRPYVRTNGRAGGGGGHDRGRACGTGGSGPAGWRPGVGRGQPRGAGCGPGDRRGVRTCRGFRVRPRCRRGNHRSRRRRAAALPPSHRSREHQDLRRCQEEACLPCADRRHRSGGDGVGRRVLPGRRGDRHRRGDGPTGRPVRRGRGCRPGHHPDAGRLRRHARLHRSLRGRRCPDCRLVGEAAGAVVERHRTRSPGLRCPTHSPDPREDT